ncbi:thiol peroxidase [Paraprevotella xylaniphila]|jgi:thiol peroxidase|uniref:thiol peroxidase n=1 Tax=Paraprevotella xylaniphila TaxID=454155 RepID=UPI0023F0EE68|nr:thiol peroxidase [Paraprevotella xylaniphila]
MTDMKKTLFLWLALGATVTAFAQSPNGITKTSAVQTGQTKNKGESIIYKRNTLHTTGKMVETGRKAPDFHLTQPDLQDVKLSDFKGKKVILNVFPSLDTPTCAVSVREFNEKASGLENTVVLCISMDLPFAQSRFCTTEGLTRVIPLSAFRSQDFTKNYGLQIADGPMKGLLARAVIVVDEKGIVRHTQLVKEISQEPDYEAALESAATATTE